MKILLCHNYYQQSGGEDRSFESEALLLETHGHKVIRYTLHNDSIRDMSRIGLAANTLWNRRVYESLRTVIRRERPSIMHCTNIFPLISPSSYYAARAEGVAVVQSLRNYRLLCTNSNFLRDETICEACIGKWVPWRGVLLGCYRQSRQASAVLSSMVLFHRLAKTWVRKVDLYFTPTEFARDKFILGGLPSQKIAVKPNFLPADPGPGRGRGGYVLYVGRLSPEKGIKTMLAAWSRLPHPIPLKIVGAGPLAGDVAQAADRFRCIEFLGWRPPQEILAMLGDAACLIIPSLCFETFGRTIIEAYAKATPVVASDLGAMAELVSDGRTGVLFNSGSAPDLAAKLTTLLHSTRLNEMRQYARSEFLLKYTAETNYRMIMNIYREAQHSKSRSRECLPEWQSNSRG